MPRASAHKANTRIARPPTPPSTRYRFGQVLEKSPHNHAESSVVIEWKSEMDSVAEAVEEFKMGRGRFREGNVVLLNRLVSNRSSGIILRISNPWRYREDYEAWDMFDEYRAIQIDGTVV